MRILVTLFGALFFCLNIYCQTLSPSGTATYCAGGGTVTLTVNGAATGSNYQWKKDGSNVGANANTYNAGADGNYTVIITPGSNNTPDTLGPVAVSSTSRSAIDFSFTPNNACAGNNVVFTSNITGGTPPYTYAWDFGDRNTSANANPLHAFTSLGCATKPFNVKLSVTDSKGCTNTAITKQITILQVPDVQLSDQNVFSPFNNCSNSPTAANPTYTLAVNNISPGAGCITSYNIDWGDGTIQNGVSFPLTHTYTTLGAFNLKVTAAGSNGCSNTKTYVVANQSNPAGSLGTLGSTTNLCAPAIVPFTISNWTLNSPGTRYVLEFGDGQSVTLDHPLNAGLTDDTVNYTYTSSSCPSPSYTAILRVSNACDNTPYTAGNIQIRIKPNADFEIDATPACVNQPVCFNNSTTAGSYGPGCNTLATYQWDFGDGGSSTEVNPCHPYNSPGTYNVTMTATNPCGTTTVTKEVCITVPPSPGFTVDNAGCAPFTANITNTTNTFGSCDNPVYKWVVTYTAAFCGTTFAYTFTNGTSDVSENPSINFTSPGRYTLTQNVTNACGTFTTSKTVDIKKPPAVTIDLPTYSCGAINITPSATIDVCSSNTATYAWTFTGGTPATASTANPGNVSFTATGNHPISLAVTNECGSTTATETVTVSVAPDIVPTADQAACGGASAGPYNFTNTIGTPTYNWTNNNTAIGLAASGTGNISAFTAINNSTVPVTAIIIVTPSVSNCAGVPDTFTITVNPQPTVPLVNSPITYCQNAPASALTATGTGANTFTWYNNAGLTGGLSTPPIPSTAAAGTTLFYVTQTNTFNCQSAAAIITINVNPGISGNTIATNQTICANTAPNPFTTGTVSGGNSAYIYQWQSSTDGGSTWSNISGANNDVYAPGILTDTIQYRRVVNSTPCSDTSNIITINVAGALTNFNIAASQITCAGFAPAPVIGESPNGGGGNYTYQWQNSSDNINWLNIGGATAADYQPPVLSVATYYRRIVSTPQCSAASNAVTITVNPTPAGSINPPVPFICLSDAGSILFTATAGTAPYTIGLVVVKPDGTPNPVTQTINSNGPAPVQVINPNSTPGPYSIQLTRITDGNGCISSNISLPFTIAVLTPIINVIKNDTTICNGQSFTILNNTLSGGDASVIPAVYSYQWESSPAGQNNWQNIPGANLVTLLASPTANTCYRRKVQTNNQCEIISNPVCLTIDPGIANNIITANQQVCVNTAVNSLQGNAANGGNSTYSYTWLTSTDSITWSIVGNDINYQPPIYAAAGVHYFRRDVISGNCTSESNVITVSVRPDAKAIFTSNPTTNCAPFDLSAAISVIALPDSNGTYNWYADNILFGSNTTGIFPGYTITNPGSTVNIKLVTISPFGCKPDSIEQQFITVQTVIARFTKDNIGGCGPLDVTFNNTSSIINNNIQFFWNFGNGVSSTSAQPGTTTFNTSPFFNDTAYQISLKAYNGCDTTVWRDSVKIRSNPNARFGVVTTFGCSPFTVEINNTSLGGPNTYYWDFGDGDRDTTSVNGPLNHTYNIGNIIDTLPIRLTAVNECGNDTQTINIRIAPNAINPQININATDLFGCAPHIVAFNNATSGATSYTWDFGDGTPLIITNNTETTVIHTYSDTGVFNVSIFMTNGCSDTTITREVTVFAKPVAAFTANSIIYCLGDTIKINNTSLNASNYRWFWGDGQSSAGSNPTHVYSAAGDYTIFLRAEKTNNNGVVCFDTLVRNITVLVRPDATLQSNIGNINCAPFTANLSAPRIIDETVTWYINDTTLSPSLIVSSGVSTQYTFNKPGTFTIKMIAGNALGCNDSISVTFTVRGTPVASFTPTNLNICKTDTTISYLNTTTFNDNGPVNYRWLVNGVLQSTNGNFTYRYITPANTILPRTFTTLLIANNTVGCSDTASAVLQMSPVADAQFSIGSTNTCVPFVLPVTDASKYTTSRKWLVNGILVDTATNPVFTITQGASAYIITLIADNIYGCKPDTFSVNFTTRSRPKASFTLNDTLGCTGRLNVATNNKSTSANFYEWNWGDNTTSTFTNPTHVYSLQGEYLITLVASDGVCNDTAQQLVKVSTKPIANFEPDITISCDTANVHFTNLTQNGESYVWSYGSTVFSTDVNPYQQFPPSIVPYTIKLVADNGLGCKDSIVKSNLITAKVPPSGDFFISPSAVISYPNYTFSFNNLTPNSNNYTYQWSLGDGSFANTRDVISHKYADTGNYPIQLIVLDAVSQCLDTTVKIARIDGFPGFLYVPNAICPGCIQSNLREFMPKGKGLAQYRLQIFTTWGELIFETSSIDADGVPNKSWDGRYKGVLMQQDVYVWRIDAKFKNGTEWLGMLYPGEGKYKKAGTITVVK